MELHKLELFLLEIGHISKEYEKMANLSGENFNIFRIMGLQEKEVRLHSAILAELLDPDGSHGQKSLFLDLFIKQFKISGFNTDWVDVEAEKYIGPINTDRTEGGQIDIILTDVDKKHIIIENKIGAGDQPNQLLRYYNFDTSAKFFYLTLHGTEPDELSTGNEKIGYEKISYKDDVIEWLEACRKEAASLPIIRETVTQYIYLLKYLTNQTIGHKMQNEIKDLIFKNKDYFDAVNECSKVVQKSVPEAYNKLEQLVKDGLEKEPAVFRDGDLELRILWGQDQDGIHFGYRLLPDDVPDNLRKEKTRKFRDLIKDQDLKFPGGDDAWYVAWFNPKPFERYRKFNDSLDTKEIFEIVNDNSKLEDLANKLISQAREKGRIIFTAINGK